jgi:hypothetical protein
MTPPRRAAVTAGALLIAGIIGALAFSEVEHPVLTATVSFAKIPANAGRLSAGGLLELATAGVSAGIAIALYPVLRTYSQGLALGSVAFRTIEAAMYAVAGVITLSLPALARQDAQPAAPGHSQIQAIANALAGVRQDAILAGVLAYITGALMYYCVLYRTRLLPRWLTGWGIAAEITILAACVAAAFSHNPVTSYTPLYLPILVQELAFAAWLILRGFSPRAAQARTATSPAPAA